jgi:hypothetical protein
MSGAAGAGTMAGAGMAGAGMAGAGMAAAIGAATGASSMARIRPASSTRLTEATTIRPSTVTGSK